jgi:hypothetical protein
MCILKLSNFKSWNLWKDSAEFGFVIIGIIATTMGVIGCSLGDIFSKTTWINRLSVLIAIYIVLVVLTAITKVSFMENGITVKIRGITVNVKKGDIFKANGWKLIPFNEYFDTTGRTMAT